MKKITLVASCALLLSACSSQSNFGWSDSQQALGQQVDTYMLHPEDNRKLQSAEVGDTINLNYSPWPNGQTRFVITKRYFAASGRQCLRIQFNSAANQAVLCDYAQRNAQRNAQQHTDKNDSKWGITPALGGTVNLSSYAEHHAAQEGSL